MAFPDLAANLVYTVLCLVPGFVSLQTVTYRTGRDPELSEFEKSTWSLVGSGASLSLSYFLYLGWMAIVTGDVRIVRPLDIGWVDLVAAYPVLLAVAFLVGYATGTVIARTPDSPATARPETGR